MDARVIEAAPPPARFARGWHCLGLADSFKDGRPHAVEAFGTKLVVFQGEDGALNVLDAYCRHMGGDLSQGTVKGDAVACPFHDWRWAGDGRCAGIPYAKRVPRAARTRAWRAMEQNRQLFVWNDPQGNPPPPDVVIPRIEGAYSDEWSAWTWDGILVEGSHCREIVDNVVDMAHFFYIHYALPTYFKNVFEGHVATQYFDGISRDDAHLGFVPGAPTRITQKSEAAYYGPSYMIDYLWNIAEGVQTETVLINCHYPVTRDSFMLQWGVIVKKFPGMDDAAADAMARQVGDAVKLGFMQDVEIWRNKAPIDNPLLCDQDGPVYQLRRWYEQFYVDVEDVTPEMTNRFEFEIDTARAVETWKKEVEENVANGVSYSVLPASMRS
ncbi:Rieske 2Fe-2S domain-containing protein [Microtetraspora niveoalba]|uniref:Rieske 2Fe-2S domain-containing protein n=1 Tax=Microtetraspora niveoalba TaxID=46175 RepID=UPI00082D8C2C|nr:Rieske 2Fe-2S domain-containing protein [Microtetraspora niveoalba]